jgi:hypothetical protein
VVGIPLLFSSIHGFTSNMLSKFINPEGGNCKEVKNIGETSKFDDTESLTLKPHINMQ